MTYVISKFGEHAQISSFPLLEISCPWTSSIVLLLQGSTLNRISDLAFIRNEENILMKIHLLLLCLIFLCSTLGEGRGIAIYWDSSYSANIIYLLEPCPLLILNLLLGSSTFLTLANSSRINNSTNPFLNIPIPCIPSNVHSSIYINGWRALLYGFFLFSQDIQFLSNWNLV